MTKEEAKLVLDNARPQTKEIDRQFYDDEDLNNAIDMAIKALEQPTSDDCVSRQAVLDKAWDVPYEGKYIQVVDVGDIQDLPPVTPTHGTCKDCKYLLRDSPDCFCCRISWRRMTNENFYCGNYEKRESQVVEMTREIWEERKNPPIDGKTDF